MEANRRAVKLRIVDKRMGTEFLLPKPATNGSAGVDPRACIAESLTIKAGAVHLIPTGIAIHLEDPGFMAMLRPRSGLGHKHGILLGTGLGILDSDFTGQVMISCWNRSQNFTIYPGDRIAQMVIVPVVQPEFQIVKEFAETERGTGGFGSPGRS